MLWNVGLDMNEPALNYSQTIARRRWRPPIRRWIKRLARWFGIFLVLLLILHQGWNLVERWQLQSAISQIQNRGEPIRIADLDAIRSDDAVNGYVELRSAIALMPHDTPATKAFDSLDRGNWFQLPLGDLERKIMSDYVEERQDVIRWIEKASLKSRFTLTHPYRGPFQTGRTDLVELRDMSVLLQIAATLEFDRGRHRQAIHLIGLLNTLTEAATAEPCAVVSFVNSGMREMQAQTLFMFSHSLKIGKGPDELDPVELRKLQQALCDPAAALRQNRANMLGDRVLMLDRWSALENAGNSTLGSPPPDLRSSVIVWLVRPYTRRNMRYGLEMLTQATSVQDAQTWPEYLRRFRNASFARPGVLARWDHEFARSLNLGFENVGKYTFGCMTRLRLTAIALGVRAYQLDHAGNYPPNLEALVPNYLPEVPTDLMGENRVIRHALNGDDPKVWSVGTNGTDEGGDESKLDKVTLSLATETNPLRQMDYVLHLKPTPRPVPDDWYVITALDGLGTLAPNANVIAPKWPADFETGDPPKPDWDKVSNLLIDCPDRKSLSLKTRADVFDMLKSSMIWPNKSSDTTPGTVQLRIQFTDPAGKWSIVLQSNKRLLLQDPDGKYYAIDAMIFTTEP